MELIDRLLQGARERGAQAEVIYVSSRSLEFSWEKESQYGMTYFEDGCGLRVIKDGRQGFAYSNRCSEDLLDMAISSAAASQPDPANGLPSPEPVQQLEGSYDSSVEQPRELLLKLIEDIRSYSDGRFNLISARSWGGYAEVTVRSTEGVDSSARYTFIGAAADANYVSESFVGPEVYEFVDSRSAGGLSVDLMMKSLSEKVELTRTRRRVDRLEGRPLVLTPKAVQELLFPLLNHAFSLENVYRGKSPLKVGDFVGVKVTIADNPRLSGGAWSRAFDGEGLPTMEVTVIRDGAFVTPLSNTYWARKANAAATHSSWRTFTSLPAISATYLVFDGPSAGDLSDAVFVDQVQGVHTSNFDTGEFAVTASLAWDSEGAIREFVLSGDLRGLLAGIEGIGRDRTRYGRVVTGPLVVRGLRTSS